MIHVCTKRAPAAKWGTEMCTNVNSNIGKRHVFPFPPGLSGTEEAAENNENLTGIGQNP